nr:3'-5' exonuclease [Methylobacterium sp. OTU13CASTA1]
MISPHPMHRRRPGAPPPSYAPAPERSVLVFDLETVPDLEGLARMYGLAATDTAGAQSRLAGKFPKLAFHRIICVGGLTARFATGAWQVEAIDAPHCGDHDEAGLIRDFDARVVATGPQIVTFNGTGFDLPVLQYRALVNRVAMPGLARRAYLHRYSEAALDLCDVLSNYQPGGKMGLDALCRALDVPGKPAGIDGSRVAEFLQAGRIAEIAAYCRADVAATYRIWLALQHMRGALGSDAYRASEDNLSRYLTRATAAAPTDGVTTAAA